MLKHLNLLLTAFFVAIAVLSGAQSAQAGPLPASDWYAVIWNRATDTLHWVNDVTEQASMARPKLPGEGQQGVTLYVSPDGRTLMVHGPLESGRDGLGFYDFASNTWTQIHEAQQGESIIAADRNPFTLNSEFAAIGLYSGSSWRVIAFETATGDAVAQLDSAHPDAAAAQIPPQAVPSVAFYDLEQNFGQWRVQIRFITLGPNIGLPQAPSLAWIPALGSVSVNSLHANLSGFDVLLQQSRVIFTVPDANAPTTLGRVRIGFTGSPDSADTVFDTPNALASKPRWVANGLMVAFRVAQQPFANMWHLMPAVGGDSTPFAPDYDELLGTSDGFILVDYEGGEVKFSNILGFEAFTPTVGNVIYTTDTVNFSVVYVTPMGAQFVLPALPDGPGGGANFSGPDSFQAPPCGPAPAPRLTVGNSARVTFTNGIPLNVRTAPGGNLVTQLAEGTVVTVLDGPTCASDYLWWNIQFNTNSGSASGWAAEGDADGYFLEPFVIGDVNPPPVVPQVPGRIQAPGIVPTATPMRIAPVPTATPPRQIAAVPTATQGFIVQINCPQSPPSQLKVGDKARTVTQGGGTLAMRTELTDAIPTYQIPGMQNVEILAGPQCREGIRMWQVSTVLNGQTVTGWIAEGFGQVYYLLPL